MIATESFAGNEQDGNLLCSIVFYVVQGSTFHPRRTGRVTLSSQKTTGQALHGSVHLPCMAALRELHAWAGRPSALSRLSFPLESA